MRIIDRLMSKVTIGPGCWEWQANKNTAGYGRLSIGGRDGRMVLAHRVAFEHFVGPVPEGRFVLHHCDNPACVRPDHLWLGDARSNAADRDHKGRHRTNGYERKTHCPMGHPYDEQNTMRPPSGGRMCRECCREATRRWRRNNNPGSKPSPAERTQCPAGHPYDDENTYSYRGKRHCKECRREAARRWRQIMRTAGVRHACS